MISISCYIRIPVTGVSNGMAGGADVDCLGNTNTCGHEMVIRSMCPAPPRSALHIKAPAPFIFLSLWLLSILILLFYSLRGKEQGFSCLERCLLFIQLFMFVAPLSERRRAGFSGLMRRADTEPPFVSAREKRQEAQ